MQLPNFYSNFYFNNILTYYIILSIFSFPKFYNKAIFIFKYAVTALIPASPIHLDRLPPQLYPKQ